MSVLKYNLINYLILSKPLLYNFNKMAQTITKINIASIGDLWKQIESYNTILEKIERFYNKMITIIFSF
jgi:hypothetical protein